MRGSAIIFCLHFIACTQSAGLNGGNKQKPTIQPANTSIGKSQGEASATIGNSDENSTDSIGDALSRCSTASLVQKNLSLSFPETKGCNWDRGEKGGAMMGHYEQRLNLDVSPNWVLCNLSVSSSKTDFYYDDTLAMTVNDRLIWGDSVMFDLLSSNRDSQGLIRFDWNQIFGKIPNNNISCMEGSATCIGPGTQKEGPVGISLSEATNLKLMRLVLQEKKLEFQLTMTGDEKRDIDCVHNGLPLDVQISYYEK